MTKNKKQQDKNFETEEGRDVPNWPVLLPILIVMAAIVIFAYFWVV